MAGNVRKWTGLSGPARAIVIDLLTRKLERSTDETEKAALRSAIDRLEVKPRVRSARRDPSTYQQSDLRRRLELPESKTQAIAAVVTAVKSAGSLEGAAVMLDISPRSLFRALEAHDDLREAVDATGVDGRSTRHQFKKAS